MLTKPTSLIAHSDRTPCFITYLQRQLISSMNDQPFGGIGCLRTYWIRFFSLPRWQFAQ